MSTITGGGLVFNYNSFLQTGLNFYDVPDKPLARQNLGINPNFVGAPQNFGTLLLPANGVFDGSSSVTVNVDTSQLLLLNGSAQTVSAPVTFSNPAKSYQGSGSLLTGVLNLTTATPQTVASPVSFTSSVSTGGQFNGSGAGLTNIPQSALVGLTKLDLLTTAQQSVVSDVKFLGDVIVNIGRSYYGDASHLTGIAVNQVAGALSSVLTTAQNMASDLTAPRFIGTQFGAFVGDGSALTGVLASTITGMTNYLCLGTLPPQGGQPVVQQCAGPVQFNSLIRFPSTAWNLSNDDRSGRFYQGANVLGTSGNGNFDYESGDGFWNHFPLRQIESSSQSPGLLAFDTTDTGTVRNTTQHDIVVFVNINATVAPAFNFSLALGNAGNLSHVFYFDDVCGQTELLYNSGAVVIFEQSNSTLQDNDRAFKPVHWGGYVKIPVGQQLGIYHQNRASGSHDSYSRFIQFTGHFLYAQ